MIILAAFFDRKNKYNKLLKVFRNSAHRIMPGVLVKIIHMRPPENSNKKFDMSFAFEATGKEVMRYTQPVAVCDIDLMFIRSIEDVMTLDFDIAVTTRNKYKYNTGIWFYKPTEAARAFVKQWMANDQYLMKHFEEKRQYIGTYAGIDQAALAMTIENNKDAKIIELPCQEWNSCQQNWKDINRSTRVVHIKSKLRLVAMKNKKPPEGHEYMNQWASLWRSYLK